MSKAQSVIDEIKDVGDAIAIYAVENGGIVNIGDPYLDQESLHFIKQKNLLKEYSGISSSNGADLYSVDEDSGVLQRNIPDEEICRMINHIRNGSLRDEPLFNCDSPEGVSASCCITNDE